MSDPFFLNKKKKTKAPKRPLRSEEDEDTEEAPPKKPRMASSAMEDEEQEQPQKTSKSAMRFSAIDADAPETADERRVRLAKEYLGRIKEGLGQKSDEEEGPAEDGGLDAVASKLEMEAAEGAGRNRLYLASKLNPVEQSSIRSVKGHSLPVTCVALSEDGTLAFSGSKDGTVAKWDVETGKRLAVYNGSKSLNAKGQKHASKIFSIALSSDSKFLVTGGEDKALHVWSVADDKHLDKLPGHRDTVSALSFRQDTHQLYSGSYDRTVKVWNIDSMGYIETLYGHQSPIMAIDSLMRERALTAGADNTLRIWKIVEETQLIFKAHTASIDCATLVNEALFLAGSQDGAISVWSPSKKVPIFTLEQAHGGQWISSLAACRRSDLVASGSSDGFLRLWEVKYGRSAQTVPGQKMASLTALQTLPIPGFVNGLAFSKSGKVMVAGLGQEHRLGRWNRDSTGRNGMAFIPLSYSDQTAATTYPCQISPGPKPNPIVPIQ